MNLSVLLAKMRYEVPHNSRSSIMGSEIKLVLPKSIGTKTKQVAPPYDTLNLLGEVFLFFYTRGDTCLG